MMTATSALKWRYCQGRLFASGSQITPDFIQIRLLIEKGRVPRNIDAIVYRAGELVMFVRGRILEEWISAFLDDC